MSTAGKTLLAVAAAAVTLAGISAAHAGTIYNDTFGRGTTGSPQDLSGTSPSPTNTGSATWGINQDETGVLTYQTDGSEMVMAMPTASSGNYGQGIAYLPYSSSAGATSAISADMSTAPTTSGDTANGWVALGFLASAASDFMGNNSGPWALLTSAGQIQMFAETTTTQVATYQIAGFTSGSFYHIAIGYNAATETATWYLGSGVNQTTLATYTYGGAHDAAPVIADAALGYLNAPPGATTTQTADVQNFLVTETPEPAALHLLGVGALGLLLVGRKRRME